MTAPDRAPAPPLGETDLASIVTHPTCGQCGQAWSLPACGPTHALIAHERQAIVPALIAALRAAWTERDEFRASFQELFETTRRYRAALEQVIDYDEMNVADYDEKYAGNALVDTAALIAQAALAAPGAGGRATEEQP